MTWIRDQVKLERQQGSLSRVLYIGGSESEFGSETRASKQTSSHSIVKETRAILGLYEKGNGLKKQDEYGKIKIEPILVR